MIARMKFWENKESRVYLDWAAATPLLPEAKAAMEPFLDRNWGNPSAIHKEGQSARLAVETARANIARALQVRPEFVTFTGGGTEGNNLAIFGIIESLRSEGKTYTDMQVLTTPIEHPSIARAMEKLATFGVSVEYVAVDSEGVVVVSDLQQKLSSKTVLCSLAYANSEIGVVQPLHRIKKLLQQAEQQFGTTIFFHVDGAQAPLWLSCQFETVGADVLVLDAAKCCGPKGVGVAICSRRVSLRPVLLGGGQEQGIRSGTENVLGIVGAGVAFAAAQANWRARAEHARAVRDKGIALLLETISGSVRNGPVGEQRLANNINISIQGIDTEYAAVWLDAKGFAVSTKSACAGAGGGESLVVKAISADAARARSTLRLTLGPDTTIADIERFSKALQTHVTQMRNLTQ